jgi:hypothetical protein
MEPSPDSAGDIYECNVDFVMQDDDAACRAAVKRKFVSSQLSEDSAAVVKDCAVHFLRNCDKQILSRYVPAFMFAF